MTKEKIKKEIEEILLWVTNCNFETQYNEAQEKLAKREKLIKSLETINLLLYIG